LHALRIVDGANRASIVENHVSTADGFAQDTRAPCECLPPSVFDILLPNEEDQDCEGSDGADDDDSG